VSSATNLVGNFPTKTLPLPFLIRCSRPDSVALYSHFVCNRSHHSVAMSITLLRDDLVMTEYVKLNQSLAEIEGCLTNSSHKSTERIFPTTKLCSDKNCVYPLPVACSKTEGGLPFLAKTIPPQDCQSSTSILACKHDLPRSFGCVFRSVCLPSIPAFTDWASTSANAPGAANYPNPW
jgi:hypothetical protein